MNRTWVPWIEIKIIKLGSGYLRERERKIALTGFNAACSIILITFSFSKN